MTDFEFAASAGQMLDAALPDESPGSEHGNGKVTCLWRRYHPRLIAMAQRHLRMSPQRLADEQDVVASAFRSFFRALREERVDRDIDDDGLWGLLVTLTTRKAIKVIRSEGRYKRDSKALDVETDPDSLVCHAPTPELAAALVEEYRLFDEQLGDESLRRLVQHKLEGYTNTEIALRLDCSVRTVKRRLALARGLLEDAIAAQGTAW